MVVMVRRGNPPSYPRASNRLRVTLHDARTPRIGLDAFPDVLDEGARPGLVHVPFDHDLDGERSDLDGHVDAIDRDPVGGKY
jgi:hypothetical protein